MKDTTSIGDLSAAMVLAELLRAGRTVLRPISDGLRYDLVIADGSTFHRVQCKTGRLKKGVIKFRAYSVSGRGSIKRHYKGEADLFGVYCPENGKVYLVPVNEIGHTVGSLRITEARNKQSKVIRMAKQFEINAKVAQR